MEHRVAVARAISKALAMGGADTVTRLRHGLYDVESASRPGQVHRVSVIGRNWFCTCPARERPACWHRAAVYVAKVEAGGVRVTGPTSTPDGAVPANVVRFQRRAA